MRALVVLESMFGNTEAVARAVADGLAERVEVAVLEVSQAPVRSADGVELIVAGGPTHAFSLSRPSTRADAIAKGAAQGEQEIGLREWLSGLTPGRHRQQVAVFDTRVEKVRRLPGSAATKAVKLARRLGYTPAGRQSFYVSDIAGPLLPGELERAKAWGAQLASELSDRSAGRTAG